MTVMGNDGTQLQLIGPSLSLQAKRWAKANEEDSSWNEWLRIVFDSHDEQRHRNTKRDTLRRRATLGRNVQKHRWESHAQYYS